MNFLIFFLLISSFLFADSLPNHQGMAFAELGLLPMEKLDANWSLQRYFGSIFVINLPQDQERLAFAAQNLQKVGVPEFEVVKAIDGRKVVDKSIWNKMDWNWIGYDLKTEKGRRLFDRQRQGETGCYLSHLKALSIVRERFARALNDYQRGEKEQDLLLKADAYQRLLKNRSVLILEDDNGFGIAAKDGKTVSIKTTGYLFRLAMKELPLDWDMFYLMTYSRSHSPNQKFSPHLAKVCGGYTTSAYAVHYTFYDTLIQELNKIFDPLVEHVLPVDNIYARLHKFHRCFAIIPSIAYQREGISTLNSHTVPLVQAQPL